MATINDGFPIKAPPIGLKPRDIHDMERTEAILQAMLRYIEADVSIPMDWKEELDELLIIE